MGFIKIALTLSIITQGIFFPTYDVNDYEEDSTKEETEYDEAYQEIYDMLDIEGVEDILSKEGFGDDIRFSDIVIGISNGDGRYVTDTIAKGVKNALVCELLANKSLMLQLVLLVLIGSIFVNISGAFGNAFISENGFYVTYLIITSIMLTSFSLTLDIVSGSIEKVLDLIRILVPVYAVAINFIGRAATSAGMYNLILFGVWIVQVVILKFIIPMIKFYVIVSLINNLNREDSFSKLCNLIKNSVTWMLKTIVVFVAGLNIIKSLIEPQIDAIGRNTVNKIIQAIPGGGIMSVLTGTFLGAGMIIKNSIGIAGIVLLIVAVMVPVIKTFIMMITVRFTSVMIQPIGDKRYVDGVEALAQGMYLLLQTILSSVVLFMLTIAIMAYASSGG
ncbi:MAG: stage III sporulation protein AE [Lachnospiraceae bacterium]|nr:stage III sporulation protein AE [Lachnospiraceae bacterium]